MKKAKIWTEKDIRTVLDDISFRMGIDCSYVPIRISNRMTSCKGLCKTKKISNKIKGIELVFSSFLINGNYDEDVVKEVIIHEYIHLYTDICKNRTCGHNSDFKHNCIIAGIKTDTYFSAKPINENCKTEIKTIKKNFIVKCIKCGKTHERVRFPKGIEYFTSHYHCSHCNGTFEVIKK